MKRYCSNCGKLFDATFASQRFCGASCVKASTPKGHFIILERDGFQCVYCGRSPLRDRALLAVDHVHPVAAGGDDRAINLVTCCRNCNSQKGTRVFGKALMRQMFAAIHDRNVAVGLDDNQRIDLGSTSADARQDIEAMSLDELKALIADEGKGDPAHNLMAHLQAVRVALAQLMPDFLEDKDRILAQRLIDTHGRMMAELEQARYRIDGTTPAFTEPLFNLNDFAEPGDLPWVVGAGDE